MGVMRCFACQKKAAKNLNEKIIRQKKELTRILPFSIELNSKKKLSQLLTDK